MNYPSRCSVAIDYLLLIRLSNVLQRNVESEICIGVIVAASPLILEAIVERGVCRNQRASACIDRMFLTLPSSVLPDPPATVMACVLACRSIRVFPNRPCFLLVLCGRAANPKESGPPECCHLLIAASVRGRFPRGFAPPNFLPGR